MSIASQSDDFVYCKSYRHKSGKIIVHPTGGYFKFPRTCPKKSSSDNSQNLSSKDDDSKKS